ncbi:MAG: YceI family protein [Cyclobacteriaceae bacterium]|jgi:polyisoprenoid-binding protein YceI|nr:YceI family protein [Cyclobacteriaceae bacterium]
MKTPTILLLTLVCPLVAGAQKVYTACDDGSIKIEGTSTMHDWDMTTESVAGTASFVLDGNAIRDINSLSITLAAESLKSGKAAMDKNAYKALKTDRHKDITFTMTDVTRIEKSGAGYNVTVQGKLTIAGATRPVQLTALCVPKDNGRIECSGQYKIRMTDYEVEPPSFMFGSVKTGDDLLVKFNVAFAGS